MGSVYVKCTSFGIYECMNSIIGRDPGSAICIPRDVDAMVSRNHCMLDIDPPTVGILDLNSRNGTKINGRPLEYSPDGAQQLFLSPSHSQAHSLNSNPRVCPGISDIC